jgi:hypothetical protein
MNLTSAGSTPLDSSFNDNYFYWNDLLFHLSSLFESYQVEVLCFEHLHWSEILYFQLGYLYIKIIIIFGVRRSSVEWGWGIARWILRPPAARYVSTVYPVRFSVGFRVPLKETREGELLFGVKFMSEGLTNLQNKNGSCYFLGCKKVYMTEPKSRRNLLLY